MAYLGILEDKQKGLTLIEFLIVIGIIAVISTAVGVKLIGVRQKNSISSTLSQITVDIKSQQIKAMVLDTEGGVSTSSYGVHFNSSSYVLFKGTAYNPTDTSNFVINLGSDISFSSVSFSGQNVIFNKGSGEISGFINGSDGFLLTDKVSSEQKNVKFNIYGVIVSVQ